MSSLFCSQKLYQKFVGSYSTSQDICQPFCMWNIHLSDHVLLHYSVLALQAAGINSLKTGDPHRHCVEVSANCPCPHWYLCSSGGLELYHTKCLNYQGAKKDLKQYLSLFILWGPDSPSGWDILTIYSTLQHLGILSLSFSPYCPSSRILPAVVTWTSFSFPANIFV